MRNLLFLVGIIALIAYFGPGNKSETKTETPQAAAKIEPTPEEAAAKRKRNEIFTRQVLAVRQLKAGMKNPDSFRLESATVMDDGTLCVFYRATNSFNAIVPGYATIRKDRIYTGNEQWSRYCAGKSGEDKSYIRQAL
ncbi:MAG: hypothetical protein KF826_15720 [Xanthobacteraceae bacterium]|nr:hypothetical protein [Xanthobacteraceae bacterium]MCW5678420.1 hypothetical protein [Xanthobacteraceae bacterium]